MKVFAISFVLFFEAVLAEAFYNSNLNGNLKPKNKTRVFRISEKAVPVIEQTYSRNHVLPSDLGVGAHSPNWNDVQPEALPNPRHSQVNWDFPERTLSSVNPLQRNPIFHNGWDGKMLPSNFYGKQPEIITNLKRNNINWIIPEQRIHEVLAEHSSKKTPSSPDFETDHKTHIGNWKTMRHILLGQVPGKSSKPDAVNIDMSHNTMNERQQQLQMETNFLPHGLDKKTSTNDWRQPQDMYNLKRNSMGWRFSELKNREVSRGHTVTKTNLIPNGESTDINHPGNLKGGQQTFDGQTKWMSPISSVYVDYPGKRQNDLRVQHQMETNYLPNGLDKKTTSSDNWRQPQDMYSLKRNSMGWVFPEHKDREVSREHPLTKTNFTPNRESNDITYSGNLKGGHQTFVGQTKWVSPLSPLYVDYPGKRHNHSGVQHQMETHFAPNGLDKKTPSGSWTQSQGMYNLKGNSMGFKFPEPKDREFSRGHTLTKSNLTPNKESNDIIHSGNLKGGHETFVGQTKWMSPISPLYNLDYPGKMFNELGVQNQQHQVETHFDPNGLDIKTPTDNWRQPQDMYNLKRNSMGWVYPEHKDREDSRGYPLTKSQFTPNRESNDITYSGNLKGGFQTSLGHTKWVSPLSSLYVDYPGKGQNDLGVQHQMETHFVPNGLDKKTPSGSWTQTQDVHNLKGNSVGWIIPELKDQKVSRGQPLTKSQFTPNRESNDITYSGNVKVGYQTSLGHTKWNSPISPLYVNYPGKGLNDLGVQHQMETLNSNAPSYDHITWTSADVKSKPRWMNMRSNSDTKWTNNAGYLKQNNYNNPEPINHSDFQTTGRRTYVKTK